METGVGSEWCGVRLRLIAAVLISLLVVASMSVSAESSLKQEAKKQTENEVVKPNQAMKVSALKAQSGYHHVWPGMEFRWKIVLGMIIGFFGAACGSVGGVGGVGIFVPMLTFIIGFDAKSSTALSKWHDHRTAVATVFYNIRQRHPTLELPVIDYDLALLVQPMLMLGISIGVAFNVIFPDWMITILLITLFTVMSIKSFLKGVEIWKKETIIIKEAAQGLELNENGSQAEEFKFEPESLSNTTPKETKEPNISKVSIFENVYWKEMALLVAVWFIILALQIAKIPVAGGISAYEAANLYKGRRKIASNGEVATNWRAYKLGFYCFCGIMAGVIGGVLGLGGGFILCPLFLEMGIPPQVSSATATFAMTFSASMSIVEYYLLKRFPVPYGQRLVTKLIKILVRASNLRPHINNHSQCIFVRWGWIGKNDRTDSAEGVHGV